MVRCRDRYRSFPGFRHRRHGTHPSVLNNSKATGLQQTEAMFLARAARCDKAEDLSDSQGARPDLKSVNNFDKQGDAAKATAPPSPT